jgi:hypothetical protein
MVGRKYLVHKWGRGHRKSSTQNVTHPSRYNFGLTDAG